MMGLPSKPLEDVIFEDVTSLVASVGVENTGIEFKREFPKPEKIARIIAGFANTWGGHILIGVEESREAPPFQVRPLPLQPAEEDRIENYVLMQTRPVVKFDMVPVSDPADESQGVWVIRVDESEEAHHELNDRGEPKVLGRFGGRSRILDLETIEGLLDMRNSARGGVDDVDKCWDLPDFRLDRNTLKIGMRVLRRRVAARLKQNEEERIRHLASLYFPEVAGGRPHRELRSTWWDTPEGHDEWVMIRVSAGATVTFQERNDALFEARTCFPSVMDRLVRTTLWFRDVIREMEHPGDSRMRCVLPPSSMLQDNEQPGPLPILAVDGASLDETEQQTLMDFSLLADSHQGWALGTIQPAEPVPLRVAYRGLLEKPEAPAAEFAIQIARARDYGPNEKEISRYARYLVERAKQGSRGVGRCNDESGKDGRETE
ncbi:MAG: ATP-binding protein [Planctomycetota bacterium]|nr:ATP-binding protein [Planctomycetota bacterium]